MKTSEKYNVIGIMSGTSMDGIDFAYCELIYDNDKKKWSYTIPCVSTVKYANNWRTKLSHASRLSGHALIRLDYEFGSWIGNICKQFIKKNALKKIDLIASHGHTIFHKPLEKTTFQIGSGTAIYAITNIPTVWDFRSLDVMLGGEGAPLVPMGDRLLFGQYNLCLNIGGIANISEAKKKQPQGRDLCFANMALNDIARKMNKRYDTQGNMAAKGDINNDLLQQLSLQYQQYRHEGIHSLGRELYQKDIQPLLNNSHISIEDILHTLCISIGKEIEHYIINRKIKQSMLMTGGGVHNKFLVDVIKQSIKYKAEGIVPSTVIIDFKEALIFGLLGVLRLRGEVNTLKTVTGARHHSCSGVLIGK